MTAAHDIIKLRQVAELKNSRAVKTISSRMHTEEDSDVRLQCDVHLASFLTQEETCTNIMFSLQVVGIKEGLFSIVVLVTY